MKCEWAEEPPDYDAMPEWQRTIIAIEEFVRTTPAFRRRKPEPIIAGLGRGRKSRAGRGPSPALIRKRAAQIKAENLKRKRAA